MKVKQTYLVPDIMPLQFVDTSICSASLDGGDTNEQFNKGQDFNEFSW